MKTLQVSERPPTLFTVTVNTQPPANPPHLP